MNAPLQRTVWLQRLAHNWRVIILSIVSLAAGYFVWDRPIPPLWVHAPTDESILVLGVTNDGRVVTIDVPFDEKEISRLRVRDGKTGKIVSDFEIPHTELSKYSEEGEISGDGTVAILGSSRCYDIVMVSLQDGHLLHPPVLSTAGRVLVGNCSPDGRYVVLDSMYEVESGIASQLLDLKTGGLSWISERETQFSPDGQSFLSYRFSGGMMQVTIRSIRDNSLILSDSLPQYMKGNGVNSCGWADDRLYVNYGHSSPGTTIKERQCWSYATTGVRLSDPRDEPQFQGYIVNSRNYASRICRGAVRGERRRNFPPDYDSLDNQIRIKIRSLGIPIEYFVDQDSWQPLSRDGSTVGERVEGLRRGFKISPNGDWLASGKDDLRVWKLPTYRSVARWCYVFLAAAAPWGLWWVLRRRTKALKAKPLGPGHDAA